MRRSPLLSLFLIGCGPGAATADDEAQEGSGVIDTDSEESGVDESSSGDDGEMNCGGFVIVTEFDTPKIIFVVDTSRSLAALWDHDADPLTPAITRWATMHAQISAMLEHLHGRPGMAEVGLVRFPSDDACGSPSELDVPLTLGAWLLDALPPADAGLAELRGESPARAAYELALAHAASDEWVGVVLLTDGRVNCVEGEGSETFDSELANSIGTGYRSRVVTWVIGVDALAAPAGEDSPLVDAHAALNELAIVGGAPAANGSEERKFYDAAQPQEWIDGHPIVEVDKSCDIDLTQTPEPPTPEQVGLVTIESDGTPVPFVEDCESQDGWSWLVEGEILVFCGAWCDALLDGADFEGEYGCPTIDG